MTRCSGCVRKTTLEDHLAGLLPRNQLGAAAVDLIEAALDLAIEVVEILGERAHELANKLCPFLFGQLDRRLQSVGEALGGHAHWYEAHGAGRKEVKIKRFVP